MVVAMTIVGMVQTTINEVIDMVSMRHRGVTAIWSVHMVLGIFERFFHENDRTRYEFMNAVTSMARDTRDHLARWRLEELGGQIAVTQPAGPILDDGAEEFIRCDDEGLVIYSSFTSDAAGRNA